MPKYRNLGIGKKLIDYSTSLPADYIWGTHDEKLKNLQHWEKRRRIVGTNDWNNEKGFFSIADL